MAKARCAITPWSQLSVAFDLCDRRHLPLRILGDSRGGVARLWRFERRNRWFRSLAFSVLAFSCAILFFAAFLSAAWEPFASTMDSFGEVLFSICAFWFLSWLGAIALSFGLGLVLSPWRLRAHTCMLLHAERLRRRHSGFPPNQYFSTAMIKRRLILASPMYELSTAVVIISSVIILLVLGFTARGSIRNMFGLTFFPILFVLTLAFVLRAASRSMTITAKGLHTALRKCVCPGCEYSLDNAGPPASIKRCPECGMRRPCRVPDNFPAQQNSSFSRLGKSLATLFKN